MSTRTDHPSHHGRRRAPNERTRLSCPHCEWDAVIRTSVQMTALTRETMYQCTNVECGHTFTALTEIVRTLSPSATPNPAINLPLSSHVRRDLVRTTMDMAQTSDYQARQTTPVTGNLFGELPATG